MKCSQVTELFYPCTFIKLHLLLSSNSKQREAARPAQLLFLFPRVMSGLGFGLLLSLQNHENV